MSKKLHVVPYDGKWAVRGEGNTRVSSTHDTQAAAIEQARVTAQNNDGEVFIHRENGQIRDRDSYGNDPNPPKDKKH